MGYRGRGFEQGEKVKVTIYPNNPIGTIVRRCKTDNRFLFVDVQPYGRVRVMGRDLEKIKDET